MKVINLRAATKDLEKVSSEIRYKNCLAEKKFNAGLIAFRSKRNADPKQIVHRNQDVLCQVLRGRGRLRVARRRIALKPGLLCHIPKGTRHDFAASGKRELLLFYWLIQTG